MTLDGEERGLMGLACSSDEFTQVKVKGASYLLFAVSVGDDAPTPGGNCPFGRG